MLAGEMTEPLTCYRKPNTSPDTDGFLEPLDPFQIWAALDPLESLGDGTHSLQYRVRIRSHPMVSLDTVFKWDDVELYVTGFRNFPREGRMELLCEVTQP